MYIIVFISIISICFYSLYAEKSYLFIWSVFFLIFWSIITVDAFRSLINLYLGHLGVRICRFSFPLRNGHFSFFFFLFYYYQMVLDCILDIVIVICILWVLYNPLENIEFLRLRLQVLFHFLWIVVQLSLQFFKLGWD